MPNLKAIAKIQIASDKLFKLFENSLFRKVASWRNRAINEISYIYPHLQTIDLSNFWNEKRKELRDILAKDVKKTMNAFDNFVIRDNIEKLEDETFDFYYQNYINYQLLQQSELITQTLIDDIKAVILKASKEQLTVRQIAKVIREEKGFTKTRAITIARTETHNAAMYAQSERAKSVQSYSNRQMYKAWIPALDERTRAAHVQMISHPAIPIEQAFSVGGEYMMFPGDPRGSASNVVNCRCSMIQGFDTIMARYGYQV